MTLGALEWDVSFSGYARFAEDYCAGDPRTDYPELVDVSLEPSHSSRKGTPL